MAVQPEHLHRALCLEGPTLGFTLCSHHLDSPTTREQGTLHFYLALGPASLAVSPAFQGLGRA